MRIAVALALAVLVGCAAQAPARKAPPPYAEAGRVIGGHLGTVILAESCAASFPGLAAEIEPALRDWRWRNDPVAAAVERRMWASVAERGATSVQVEEAKASFERELKTIGTGIGAWFAGWPVERQHVFCNRMTARLALGEDDLARRFPAEVRRWQGATR